LEAAAEVEEEEVAEAVEVEEVPLFLKRSAKPSRLPEFPLASVCWKLSWLILL